MVPRHRAVCRCDGFAPAVRRFACSTTSHAARRLASRPDVTDVVFARLAVLGCGFVRICELVGPLVRYSQQSSEHGDWSGDQQDLIPATLMGQQMSDHNVTAVPSE